MKYLSELLSLMAFYAFGQKWTTSLPSGQSEKGPSSPSQAPSTQPCIQSTQELNFTENMASFLILLRSKATEELKTAELTKEIAETQLSILQGQNRPHRTYAPVLKHDGLEWIATFGYDDSGEPALVARGSSPSEALTNFDFLWLGMDPPE